MWWRACVDHGPGSMRHGGRPVAITKQDSLKETFLLEDFPASLGRVVLFLPNPVDQEASAKIPHQDLGVGQKPSNMESTPNFAVPSAPSTQPPRFRQLNLSESVDSETNRRP